ncbi:hypothetical protein AUC43_12985 [Hymenobacter sedentarius]|uniref:DUF3885 domain-containing protein n=1 Tax=Hymenobacter sedentarius TaxID=1411621 RepID=A0A0U4BQC2_9BACT|nr:hypothetical protein [Hymenobacter sedentarius]ALW85930.1 hypothetical protein AUC43_12985 [Hymenobacter sedentarius]
MVAADFHAYWCSTYPEAMPLGYRLRITYPDRWLRIHSLPEAQRYPGDDADWAELLGRQFALFADLVSQPADLILVTGEYEMAAVAAPPPWAFTAEGCLRGMAFTALPPVALSTLPPNPHVPDEYEPGDLYRPVCTLVRWTAAVGEGILREIAEGAIQAFFVSIEHACLIAPYDGGVDIIFSDEATRNQFRDRYSRWVSPRADGL